MSLSDEIILDKEYIYVDKEGKQAGILFEREVKEFIKEFKKEVEKRWDINSDIRDITESALIPHEINDIIDELAGEKLI